MIRSIRNAVVLFVPILFVLGCGEKKTGIPTKLDQPLPTVAGSGGNPPPADKSPGNNKNVQPNKAAD